MWSGWLAALVLAAITVSALHITNLHATQPTEQISPIDAQATGPRWRERLWEDLCEGLTFEIEVGSGVAHRSVEARMPTPLADGREVDPRFEQADPRTVTNRMRMDAFIAKRNGLFDGDGEVLV